MTTRSARLWAALTGVVAAAALLGSAEVLSALFGAAGSPVFAVGSLMIDLAPHWVKDTMIALFGTGDKAALFVLLAILIIVGSGAAGILELTRPPWGVVVFGAASLLAVIAVVTRAGATPLHGAPTIVGAVVGIVVLRLGLQRLSRWRAFEKRQAATRRTPGKTLGPQIERRRFLTFAIVTGAIAVAAGGGARAINSMSTAVVEARKKIKLPTAAVPAGPVPATASLDVPGITSLVSRNSEFYRIDTALQVPSIDSTNWKLKITGMVENEIEIGYEDILGMPLVEHYLTLDCVSNDVGGNLIGNALWLGYPIRDLLKKAVPKAGADMLLSTSIDGFTAGTPLSVLQDDTVEALLAVGMNGEPLPLEHGFPARMVVPGLYGYVSATKWIVEMKVTTFAKDQGYWTPRGWSAQGPVKMSSRIDTPGDDATVTAASSTIPIAGVAWDQHTGIARVEVQVDQQPWVDATLADPISADTWRQWVYRWTPTKGAHTIQVRATNAKGVVQSQQYVRPDPNGSEGWHSISVKVA